MGKLVFKGVDEGWTYYLIQYIYIPCKKIYIENRVSPSTAPFTKIGFLSLCSISDRKKKKGFTCFTYHYSCSFSPFSSLSFSLSLSLSLPLSLPPSLPPFLLPSLPPSLSGVPLSKLSNYDGSWGEWGNQRDNSHYPVVS